MTATLTMNHSQESEETNEQRLWRAVISSTVEEWINGPLRRRLEAEKFLFSDKNDFQTVCYSAGINPKDLRCRLEKIRARQASGAQLAACNN